MRFLLRSLVLSSLLVACSASTPVVQTPPEPSKDLKAPAVEQAVPDTSPVAAPANLVMVLRATNPRKAWETINRWQPLPVDPEKELAKKTDGVSNYLEWSESFDLALTVEPASLRSGKPEFRFAASIPLKGNTTELLDQMADAVQRADAIVRDEIHKAGLERELWQSFAVLAADGVDAATAATSSISRSISTAPIRALPHPMKASAMTGLPH